MKKLWQDSMDGMQIQVESIMQKNMRVLSTQFAQKFIKNLNAKNRHYHNMYQIRHMFAKFKEFE